MLNPKDLELKTRVTLGTFSGNKVQLNDDKGAIPFDQDDKGAIPFDQPTLRCRFDPASRIWDGFWIFHRSSCPPGNSFG